MMVDVVFRHDLMANLKQSKHNKVIKKIKKETTSKAVQIYMLVQNKEDMEWNGVGVPRSDNSLVSVAMLPTIFYAPPKEVNFQNNVSEINYSFFSLKDNSLPLAPCTCNKDYLQQKENF